MKPYIKGFTLVELIIVIAIIALLATIGISTYSSVQKDGRNVRRKADLKELKTALESYKAKNGEYPSTIPNGVGRAGCIDRVAVSGDGWWCGTCSTYGSFGDTDSQPNNPLVDDTGYIPNLAPEFIPKLPRDPRESKMNSSSAYVPCQNDAGNNCYLYNSNGTDYKLLAHCTPEGTLIENDAYYDPVRPNRSWQVTSGFDATTW